jgi:hypothetical protein
MPLQNRVTPTQEIIVHPMRGLFMGNRGILHDENQQLGRSRWKHTHWIICLTKFRGRHRPVMTPRKYTELFFLDEAVALAAGHRPCAECRREDYNSYMAAIRTAFGGQAPRAGQLDQQLQSERVSRTRKQITHRANVDDLPDGTFIRMPGEQTHTQGDIRLLAGGRLLLWEMEGYLDDGRQVSDLVKNCKVDVLTPPTSVLALRAGYQPVLHPDIV